MKELLQRIHDRISQGFCQNTLARNKAGKPVSPKNDDACMWCLTGAVLREIKTGDEKDISVYQYLSERVWELTDGRDYLLSDFNDSHPKEEVLAFLDGVISKL